jgi:two-component sensor histidine kinase
MEAGSENDPQRVRPFFQVLVGATVLGLLTAAWIAVIGRIQEEDVEFFELAFYVMPFWYLWALFLLPVVRLARLRPIEQDNWFSRTAMHIVVALLLGLVHTLTRFALELAAQVEPGPEGEQGVSFVDVMGLATLEAPVHLFIYGAILGVTYIGGYRRRLRERELATTQLSEQLALARVQALRMQINPHFLFNAMNSISMLVRDRKQEEAVKTIAGLSDLLRYVLDETADQEVPLRRELAFIERYLSIEQIRFQDRLRVSVSAPEDALDALVPNLVLQPLVENAIRHGVSRSAALTTIEISAHVKNERLVLQVLDDGPGFTDETPRAASSGLGIANTRKRLTQLYGDGYVLELDQRAPHGVAVRLSLPLHTTPVLNGAETQ